MNNQRIKSPGRKTGNTWLISLLLPVLASIAMGNVSALDFGPDFNHDETMFPLDFKHAVVKCEICHVQAIFADTPRRCSQCHSNSGRIKATPLSSQHIRVTPDCEYCHQPISWTTVVRVDHFAVIGSCQSCHNGIVAEGKNPGHIQSNNVCDDCHRTYTWSGAAFKHEGITNNCIRCHNGAVADGKNPTHILTSNSCEDCHRTFGWSPVLRVDHASVFGACFSCHNGVTANGKDRGHIASVNDCELCHSTVAWAPAIVAQNSPLSPVENRIKLAYSENQGANTRVVAWSNAAYLLDYGSYQAGGFQVDLLKKSKAPDVIYNVSRLAGSNGACQANTDSRHRISDGDS